MKALRRRLPLLALLAVLCAGAAFSLWLKGGLWGRASIVADPAEPLPRFDPNAVKSVAVSWKGIRTTLFFRDGAWLLQERYGHPADFSKVASLVRSLSELKPVKILEDCDGQTLKSLRLFENVEEGGLPGVKVELHDEAGKELFNILLGKGVFPKSPDAVEGFDSKAASGRYALCRRPGAEPLIFISSKLFEEYPPTPQAWLAPLRLRLESLKSMSVSPSKSPAWEISRMSDKEPFSFVEPKERRLSQQDLVSLLSALSKPFVLDVLPKDAMPDVDLAESCVVDMETFDGFSYKFALGVGTGKAFLKMSVGYAPQEGLESGRAAERQARFESERRLSGWTYVIPFKIATALMACPDGHSAKHPETPAK